MMPPWKVLALTPSWHAAQDAVTPVWLKAEFLKLTPVIAEVMLVPDGPTWQSSQPSFAIGMCLVASAATMVIGGMLVVLL
jgi:hypothetical protein